MGSLDSKIKIAQLAAIAVGDHLISLETDDKVSAYVNAAYEPLVESELSLHPWRFATLHHNLKPNLLADDPLSRWGTAYQLPTDKQIMSIHTVLINDEPIKYNQYQDQIHTDRTADDDVILEYRYRAP